MLLALILGIQSVQPSAEKLVLAGAEAAALSASLGRPVRIAPGIGREMLYVRAGAAKPMAMLSALARALHASIVQSPAGFAIRRTKADLAELLARRTAAREDWFGVTESRLSTYRRPFGGSPPASAIQGALALERKRMDDLMAGVGTGRVPLSPEFYVWNLLPSATLLDAWIKRIGPRDLAEIPTGEVRVYETDPGPGALELPDSPELLAAYSATISNLRDSGLHDAPAPQINGYTEPGTSHYHLPPAFTVASAEQAQPVLARLSVRAGTGSINCWLELYDRSGERLDDAVLNAAPEPPYVNDVDLIAATQALSGDTQIVLSKEAQAAARFGFTGMLDRVLPLVERPDLNEPLDPYVGPAIAAMVSDTGAVVVDVPDDLLSTTRQCVRNGLLSPGALRLLLKNAGTFEETTVQGIRVLRPIDPEYVEGRRADRVRLAKYAKGFLSAGVLETRARTQLYHEGYPNMWAFAARWADGADSLSRTPHGIVGNGQGRQIEYAQPNVLAFLGCISDADWDALEAGKTLTIEQMGLAKELEQLLSLGASTSAADQQTPYLYQEHPAEALRDQGPGSVTISIPKTANAVFRAWDPRRGETAFLNVWIPRDRLLSLYHARRDAIGHLSLDRAETEQLNAKRFDLRFAMENVEEVAVRLPHGLVIRARLSATYTDQSGVETYADLPQDVKDRIWQNESTAAQRKAPTQEPGQGPKPVGTGIPPP